MVEFKDKDVQQEYDMLEMERDSIESDLYRVERQMQSLVDNNEQG